MNNTWKNFVETSDRLKSDWVRMFGSLDRTNGFGEDFFDYLNRLEKRHRKEFKQV